MTVALTLGANARGDMLVAWTRGHHVRASYREAGSAWQDPFVFADGHAYSLEAVANVNRSGEADIVFPAGLFGRESLLRAHHRDNDGDWTGQTIAHYATGIHFPLTTFDVSIDRRGDIAAAWMRRDSADDPWRIFTSYQPSGEAFESQQFVASVLATRPWQSTDQGRWA